MRSIRRQLVRHLSVGMAAVLTVGGTAAWWIARHALIRQFDASLLAKAEIIRASIEEDDEELEVDFNLDQLAGFDPDVARVFYEVRDRGGTLLLSSSSLDGHRLPAVNLSPATGPVVKDIALHDGGPARAVAVMFDASDDLHGLFRGLTLTTARRSDDLRAASVRLALILTATGTAALLLLLPLIRTVLRVGLRPLEQLARDTADIDVTKLDTRLRSGHAPEELRAVVTTLNDLLARLEASFARERRFSSDVAHELRTPVAELRSLAELATKWPDQADAAAFADVLAISREMEDLVRKLTHLARADAGTQPVEREPLDLRARVAEAVDRHAPQADARGLRLERRLARVSICSDATLWRLVIGNLVGNAVAHAPSGSVVRISLTPATFEVQNAAPDLGADDLAHFRERFWRKDAARSGYGHSGLGLALVDSALTLLGCELRAELSADGHLTVRVEGFHALAAGGSETAHAAADR